MAPLPTMATLVMGAKPLEAAAAMRVACGLGSWTSQPQPRKKPAGGERRQAADNAAMTTDHHSHRHSDHDDHHSGHDDDHHTPEALLPHYLPNDYELRHMWLAVLNGTIVGALAGLAIYAVAQAVVAAASLG